jgi:hypothetical protein
MTFTEEKCNFIQSPAVNAVLPKLHLNQHTARSIIFGPSEYGGLNLPNLYCSQGIGQLHLFIGHLGEQDKSGRLILLSMSYVQLIIGSGESFLHKPFPKYERWLDHNWLTSLWCFISKIKLKITVKRQWKPSLPRENDVFLMDSFITHGYKKVELQLLNQCRLYLQALTLSDICSADGKDIVIQIYEGEKLKDRRSTLNWPKQQCPGIAAWKCWRAALTHLAETSISQRPLGKWLSEPHQQWFWYMDPQTSILFHHPNKEEWTSHAPFQHSRGRRTRRNCTPHYQFSGGVTCQPPNNVMPATLTNLTNDTFKATMSSTGLPPSPPPSEAALLQSLNDHLWYHP